MKTKKSMVVFLSLVLVFGLVVTLNAQPKTIKIGAIYPFVETLRVPDWTASGALRWLWRSSTASTI